MNLTELLNNYNTPFYVFDFDKVIDRIHQIQNRIPTNTTLCYAIKANPFLLHAIKDLPGILFEVCSEGELEICKKLNVSPDKIVFSGVMKNQEMIKNALEYGVETITLESISHLSDLISVLPYEKQQNVIVRVSSGNQFGMSMDDLYKLFDILSEKKNIHVKGIHYFSGTQKKASKIEEELKLTANIVREIENRTKLSDLYIEYGPGLAFEYFGDDFSSNFSDLENMACLLKDSCHKYVIELGRFIASPCGTYFSKVCDIKENFGINYLILDGGINHINYYGQIMGMKIPPLELIHMAESDVLEKEYCLCGSLCTVADVITKKVSLKGVSKGDVIKFNYIGAYSISEGIYLFLSHDLPLVFGKIKEDYILLRNTSFTYILNC